MSVVDGAMAVEGNGGFLKNGALTCAQTCAHTYTSISNQDLQRLRFAVYITQQPCKSALCSDRVNGIRCGHPLDNHTVLAMTMSGFIFADLILLFLLFFAEDTSSTGPSSPPPTPPPAASLLLGHKAPATALVAALVEIGLQPEDAVGVVGGVLGCGARGGGSVSQGLVSAWQHSMLDGVPVWSNLALATARATALLQRRGTHDVEGMLVWVEKLCKSIVTVDEGGGGEGEGIERGDGDEELLGSTQEASGVASLGLPAFA